jgi:hypothetical protein
MRVIENKNMPGDLTRMRVVEKTTTTTNKKLSTRLLPEAQTHDLRLTCPSPYPLEYCIELITKKKYQNYLHAFVLYLHVCVLN